MTIVRWTTPGRGTGSGWRPAPASAGLPVRWGPGRRARARVVPTLARALLAASGVVAAVYLVAGLRAAPPHPVVAGQASWQATWSPALPGGPGPVPQSSVSPEALQKAVTAAATIRPAAHPQPPAWLTPAVAAAANRTGLPAALLAAVVQAESEGNPHAVSPAGAKGLMQLMPATAAELGVPDIFDPVANASGGAQYLEQWLLEYAHGDRGCVTDPAACPTALRLALAAYNAGPNAVKRYGGVPPYAETERYIQEVLGLYSRYSAGGS